MAAAAASAQHPGRHLESRRASAPVVYLARVAEVREVGPADAATGTAARMEATLTPLKIYRPSPPPSPPGAVVVRYEQAGRTPDEAPAPVAYTLAAGDHVLVFASSFETGFPLEMAAGNARALAAQVTALRDHLARMDASQAALHGATPAVKAQQAALYGRILGDLGGPRLP
jgi:hypothetical protein